MAHQGAVASTTEQGVVTNVPTEAVTLATGQQLIVSGSYTVFGTLTLQGTATLRIL